LVPGATVNAKAPGGSVAGGAVAVAADAGVGVGVGVGGADGAEQATHARTAAAMSVLT